jgi:hypothetical protein
LEKRKTVWPGKGRRREVLETCRVCLKDTASRVTVTYITCIYVPPPLPPMPPPPLPSPPPPSPPPSPIAGQRRLLGNLSGKGGSLIHRFMMQHFFNPYLLFRGEY